MFSGVLLLWLCYSSTNSSPIGVAIKKCHINDDNLDGCLKNNLNAIIPQLKSGWESMDLPGIDPVTLPKNMNPKYHDGNITLDILIADSTLQGLSTTRIHFVRSKTLSIGKLELMTTTPSITYTGQYTSNGYTSLFPLHSSGFFNITLVDVNTAWIAYLTKIKVGDKYYFGVENLKMEAMPLQILIEGAHEFDGSNEIAQDMNAAMNANSIELYDLFKPSLMNFISAELQTYINVALSNAPANVLIPGLQIQQWKK